MKKQRKTIAIILCVAMAVASGVIMTGCMNSAKSVADKTLKEVQQQKGDMMSQMDITKSFTGVDFTDDQKAVLQKFIKKLCDFDYDLGKVKTDKNTASVDVTFHTYDFKTMYQDMMQSAQKDAVKMASDGKVTADNVTSEMYKLVIGYIDKGLGTLKDKNKTTKTTMKLTKKDGKWTVGPQSSDFYSAMMGGLTDLS